MSDRYPEFPPETMSVTEVLTQVGIIDSRFYTPASAERGTQVHLACQYLAENRLDWESVDPEIEPWVRSYEKFLDRARWIAKATEEVKYDAELKICGRYDVTFQPSYLIDLKTGGPAPWHKSQVGTYWHLDGRKHNQVGSLYLQSDGSIAKLITYNPVEGFRDFMTALNFLRLKERYA